jgi:hypothetical protein
MKATRAGLSRKLRALKRRVFGTQNQSATGARSIMPVNKSHRKRTKLSSARGGKKTGAARKNGAKQSGAARNTGTKATKRSASKKKSSRPKSMRVAAKKVLGDVLTRAAVGAVAGAVAGVASAAGDATTPMVGDSGAGTGGERAQGKKKDQKASK